MARRVSSPRATTRTRRRVRWYWWSDRRRRQTEVDLTPAFEAVKKLIDAGAKPRVAAKVVAELTGASANALYNAATS